MPVGAEGSHPQLLQLGSVRCRIGVNERKIDFGAGINTLLAELFLFLTQYSWHAMHGKKSRGLHIGILRKIKWPEFLHLVGANAIAGDRFHVEHFEIQRPGFIGNDMKFRETIRN